MFPQQIWRGPYYKRKAMGKKLIYSIHFSSKNERSRGSTPGEVFSSFTQNDSPQQMSLGPTTSIMHKSSLCHKISVPACSSQTKPFWLCPQNEQGRDVGPLAKDGGTRKDKNVNCCKVVKALLILMIWQRAPTAA